MAGKALLRTYIAALSALLVLFFGPIYLLDPLRVFHTPLLEQDRARLSSNMRIQAAGIINCMDFDSIILGTSSLENTSAREASARLGGKFVNISLSGSDFYERSFVLRYALRKKDIRTVFYSLDHRGLVECAMGRKKFPVEEFDYLYNRNPFDDFKAYLNAQHLKKVFTMSPLGRKTDWDRPNAWLRKDYHMQRFGGLENWLAASGNAQIQKAFSEIVSSAHAIRDGKIQTDAEAGQKIEKALQYLDAYLISFVRDNPETRFVFVLPPYSRLRNGIYAQHLKPVFKRIRAGIEYLVDRSAEFGNMEVFGWDDMPFPNDISNYKDPDHYSPEINSLMLEDISKGEGLITPGGFDEYWAEFERQSLACDVVAIGEKIEAYLRQTEREGGQVARPDPHRPTAQQPPGPLP